MLPSSPSFGLRGRSRPNEGWRRAWQLRVMAALADELRAAGYRFAICKPMSDAMARHAARVVVVRSSATAQSAGRSGIGSHAPGLNLLTPLLYYTSGKSILAYPLAPCYKISQSHSAERAGGFARSEQHLEVGSDEALRRGH